MAKNQVTVGMTLKFEGIKDLDKTLDQVQKGLGGISKMVSDLGVDLKIDKKGLKQLQTFLNSIHDAMKQFKAMAAKDMKITLSISDDSVKKFKSIIEGAFREALTRAGRSAGAAAASSASDTAASGPKSRSPRGSRSAPSGGGDKSAAEMAIESVEMVGENVTRLKREIEALIAGFSGALRKEAVQIKAISEQIGRDVVQGFSYFSKSNAAAFLSELNRNAVMAGAAMSQLEEVIRELTVAEQAAKGTNLEQVYRQQAQSMRALREELSAAIAMNEQLAHKEGWRQDSAKAAIGLNNRLARSQHDLNQLMASSAIAYSELATSERGTAAARINSLIKPSERLQRQLVEDQKATRRWSDHLVGYLAGVEREFSDVEKRLKSLQALDSTIPQGDSAQGRLTDGLKGEITLLTEKREALAAEREAIKRSIEVAAEKDRQSYHQSAAVHEEIQGYRTLERILTESSRVIEATQRKFYELEFSTKRVDTAIQNLSAAVKAGSFEPSGLARAKKGLSDLDAQVTALRKNLSDLRAARDLDLASERNRMQSGAGIYGSGSEASREKAFQERTAFIASTYEQKIRDQTEALARLTEYQNGPATTSIKNYIENYSELDRADQKVRKLADSVRMLQQLQAGASNVLKSRSDLGDIRIAAEQYNKVEKSIGAVAHKIKGAGSEIKLLTQRLTESGAGGDEALSRLRDRLGELRSMYSSLTSGPRGSSQSHLVDLVNDFDKAEVRAREFYQSLDSLSARAQRAMQDTHKIGPAAIAAAEDFKKVRAEIAGGLTSLNKMEDMYRRLDKSGIKLSADDHQFRAQVEQARNVVVDLNSELVRNAHVMQSNAEYSKRMGQELLLNSKAIEQAHKKYYDLEFAAKRVGEAFGQLSETMRSDAFELSGVEQTKKTLREVDSQVDALRKNLADLKNARALEMRAEYASMEAHSGAYATGDQADRARLFGERQALIDSKYEQKIKAQQAALKEFTEYQNGPAAAAAKRYVQQFSDLDRLDKKMVKLSDSVKAFAQLSDSAAAGFRAGGTTDELRRMVEYFDKAEKSAGGLERKIKEVEAEILALSQRMSTEIGGQGRHSAKVVEETVKRLKVLKQTHQELLASYNSGAGALRGVKSPESVRGLLGDFDKAGGKVKELERNLEGLTSRAARTMSEIHKLGPTAISAATEFRQIRSEVASGLGALSKMEDLYRRLSKAGIELTDSDRRLKSQIDHMKSSLVGLNSELGRNSFTMERNEKISKRLGQSFSLYNRELADSIFMNMRFVHALTYITSALFALRSGLMAVVEESKSLAQTMTVLESVSMSTSQTFDMLREKVREASVSFGVPFADAAQVIYEFGSAGLQAEEAFDGLETTLQTMVGTGGDVTQYARTAAGIYNVFGESIRRTNGELSAFGTINDVVALAYKNHQIELDEINQGIKYVGAAANVAGFTFQDTAAMLAVLNDNLIKSGTAGRGLQVVFAQLANKTQQIEKVFDFKIDPDEALPNQMIALLEKINEDIGKGAIVTSELEKNFDIMGLRGARSFITLAQNIDKVKDAMLQFNEHASSGSLRMSEIVKDSLARRLEQTKQVFLDMARALEGPLTVALTAIVYLIKQFREGFESLGIVGKLIGGFTVLAGAIFAAGWVMAGLATFAATLNKVIVAQVVAWWANIKSLTMYATTAYAAAASTSGLTGAGAAATGVFTVLSGAIKGVVAALGGWHVLILLILAAVPLVLGVMGRSIEEINQTIRESMDEIREFNDELNRLERFGKDLEGIQRAMDTTAISAEAAGQKIRDAFGRVGETLIEQGKLFGKTAEQVAFTFREIHADAQRQIDLQRAAIVEARMAAYDKGRDALFERVEKEGTHWNTSFKEGMTFVNALEIASGNFNKSQRELTVLSQEAERRLSDSAIDTVLIWVRTLGNLPVALNPVARMLDVEGYNADMDAIKKVSKIRLQELKKQYREARSEAMKLAADSEVPMAEALDALHSKLIDSWFEGNKDVAEKFFAQYEKHLLQSIKILDAKSFDIYAHTAREYQDMLKVINAPIQETIVTKSVKDLRNLQQEAIRSQRSIMSLRAGFVDRITNPLASIADQGGMPYSGLDWAARGRNNGEGNISLRIKPELIRKQLAEATRDLDEVAREKLTAALNTWGPYLGQARNMKEALDLAVLSLTDKTAGSSQIADEFGRILISGDKLMTLFGLMADYTGEMANGAEKLRNALAGIAVQDLLAQRAAMFTDVLRDTQRAIFASFTLNDVRKLNQELTVLKNTAEAIYGLEKLSDIDLFEKSIATYTQSIETQSSTSELTEKEIKDNQNEALKELVERTRLLGEIGAKMLEIRILNEKNIAAYKTANLLLRQQRRGYIAEANALRHRVEQERLSAANKVVIDTLSQRLTGSTKESAAAAAELLDIMTKQVALRREFLESIEKEQMLRLDLLEKSAILLGYDEKATNAYYKIEKSLQQIAVVNERLYALSGSASQQQSELLQYYKMILDASENILEVEKVTKKTRRESIQFLQDQAKAFRNIRDELKTIAESYTQDLEKAFGNALDAADIFELRKIARAIGMDFESVLVNKDQAVKRLVEGVKAGTIDLDKFSGGLKHIMGQLQGFHGEQMQWQNELNSVLEDQRASALKRAEMAIAAGNIERATEAMTEFENASSELFKGQYSRAYIEDQKTLIAMRERLAGVTERIEREVQIKLGIDPTQFNYVFDAIRQRIAQIRAELKAMGQDVLDSGRVVDVASGLAGQFEFSYFKNEEVAREISRSFSELNASIWMLADVIKQNGQVIGKDTNHQWYYEQTRPKATVDTDAAMIQAIKAQVPKGVAEGLIGAFTSVTGAATRLKKVSGGRIQKDVETVTQRTQHVPTVYDRRMLNASEASVAALGQGNIIANMVKRNTTSIADSNLEIKVATADQANRAATGGRDSLDRSNKELSTQLTQKYDGLMKQFLEKIDAWLAKSPLVSAFLESIPGVVAAAGKFLQDFATNTMVPTFAFANAKIRKNFLEQIEDVERAYVQQFNQVEIGLQRNQSSYHDYINAIQDAERQRIQARIDAEREYRKQLQKTGEVFGKQIAEMSDLAVGFAADRLSGLMDALSEKWFGSLEENIKGMFFGAAIALFDRQTVSFGEFFESIGNDIKGWVDSFKDSADMVVDFFKGDLASVAEKLGEVETESLPTFLGSLGKSIGNITFDLATMLGLGVAAGVGSIVSATTEEDSGKSVVRYIEKFARELPTRAVDFIDALVKNVDRIFEAIAKNLPAVMDALIEQLPRFLESLISTLESTLPRIVEALADAIPRLVKAITPILMRLLGLLIEQIPKILGAIAEAVPLLITEIIKGLPRLLVSAIEALVVGAWEMLKGLVKGLVGGGGTSVGLGLGAGLGAVIGNVIPGIGPWIGAAIGGALGGWIGGIFHDGGLIGQDAINDKNEVLILAQNGEGILSHQGMAALGGVRMLDQLNQGKNPWARIDELRRRNSFHTGGVIGRTGFAGGSAPMFVPPSRSSVTYNNNINIEPRFERGMSDIEVRRQAREFAAEIDRELAKRVTDNRSDLYRAVDRRR